MKRSCFKPSLREGQANGCKLQFQKMRERMDYTFFANLQREFALAEKGILSRVLHKDEKVNVT
jgi:hypothetical protein